MNQTCMRGIVTDISLIRRVDCRIVVFSRASSAYIRLSLAFSAPSSFRRFNRTVSMSLRHRAS